MRLRIFAAATAALVAVPAAAQRRPRGEGMPLSEIIANAEANPEVRDIRDIECGDDG